MVSAAALAFHRKQYELQGFTILVNSLRPDFLTRMTAIVTRTREDEFVEGDESSHSWKEIAIDPPLSLLDITAEVDLAALLGREPDCMTHWLNVYESGEYIGAHVDAGGDAQLMIPVEMPPPGEGGDLWVENKGRILPIAVGDMLLFAAHRLRHGTTIVTFGRRISFNGRIWLRQEIL